MHLVRQIQISRSPLLDEVTIASKNLYNLTLYEVRQFFFRTGKWMRYNTLWKNLDSHPAYIRLKELCGSHPPQQVLKQVDLAWKGFFSSLKAYKMDPSKFQGRPSLPRYKPKHGRNVVYFTCQQCRLKDGYVFLTQKMMGRGFLPVKTDLANLKGVRIVPYGDRYNLELHYEKPIEDLKLNKKRVLGIDIGMTNLATASDNLGGIPLIIKGGAVKSINQYYNKQLAKYLSLDKLCNNVHITNRILKLHRIRNIKIQDIFHKTSHKIIDTCTARNIGTLVIGYNEGWKQRIKIGKKNNQNFVCIPFLKLINQIEYKAKIVGIKVFRVTEEYTSQMCSNCGIVRKVNRKYRGLYRCNICGNVMNADVNASQNILKKVVPNSAQIGDRGCLDHPVVCTMT